MPIPIGWDQSKVIVRMIMHIFPLDYRDVFSEGHFAPYDRRSLPPKNFLGFEGLNLQEHVSLTCPFPSFVSLLEMDSREKEREMNRSSPT